MCSRTHFCSESFVISLPSRLPFLEAGVTSSCTALLCALSLSSAVYTNDLALPQHGLSQETNPSFHCLGVSLSWRDVCVWSLCACLLIVSSRRGGRTRWQMFHLTAMSCMLPLFSFCAKERKAVLLVCRKTIPTVRAGDLCPGLPATCW